MADATYDLVITGGRVVDPTQGLDGPLDVAIAGGRIAAVGKGLASQPTRRVVKADGALVCPGLIDLHVHVYEWVTNFGVWADDAGVDAGATTVVDQGSSGAWTYGGFKAHVIDKARTDVRAFVSINVLGAVKGGMEGPRLHNPSMVEIDELVALARANPAHIRGFKCHAESGSMSHWGLQVLEMAGKAGRLADLPLYVHTGELFPVDEPHRPRPEAVMATALKVFKPGDVLAHVYSSMPDGIVGHGEGIPEFVRRAADNGILFDIGYGINFSYAIARKMMAAGIYPHTISSDTHGDFNAYHDNSKLDYSLCGAMTRLWALGMPLDRVVTATTLHPAQILREEARLGSLKPGRAADVTILDMIEGEWQMRDGNGQVMQVKTRLVPSKVVRAGEVIESKRTYVRDVWPQPLPAAAE